MKITDFNQSIPTIEGIIGYVFRDKALLRQAFTRSSWCNENGIDIYQSNEVLEFFGDSVLSAAVVTFLLDGCSKRYEHGIRTELGEGDFSNIKSKLSDKTNLSGSTKRLGLEKYLLLGEGDAKLGIADEPSVMEDLFESIVGAVYIDSGRDMAEVIKLVGRILDTSVYTDGRAHSASPKNELQEWCADKKRRLPPPIYKTISEDGPDHKKVYVRGVYIEDKLIATASGKNQKSADAAAARAALEILAADDDRAKPESPASSEASASISRINEQPSNGSSSNQVPTRASSTKAATSESTNSAKPKAQPKSNQKPTEQGGSSKPTGKAKQANAKPESPAKKEKRQEKEIEKARPARSSKKAPKAPKQSAVARLKQHAEESSAASPSFKDLGMSSDGHGSISYRVECTFMGNKVVASADSRIEAREQAAALIVKSMKLK